MRRVPLVSAGLVLAALASSAPAQQIGSPMPELDPLRWYNSPPMTLEELRGKAVLIEVFRTWCTICPTTVGALNSKLAKQEKDGLMVIGITRDEPVLVEHWIETHGVTFPVVVLETAEVESAIYVPSFPRMAVIDPTGTLIWAGDHTAYGSPLRQALEGAKKGSLHPRSMSRAVAAIRKGDRGAAFAQVDKALGKSSLKDEERQAGEKLREWLEETAQRGLEEAREQAEKGDVYKAVGIATPIARCKPPYSCSQVCARFLEELEARPDYRLEMKAGKMFAGARVVENRMDRVDQSIATYEKIIDKYPELPIARLAGERIKAAQEMIKRSEEYEERRKKGGG